MHAALQVDAATGAALLATRYLEEGIHEAHAYVLHGVMGERTGAPAVLPAAANRASTPAP
jgi:uncharacterized protein (DUF1810 family)